MKKKKRSVSMSLLKKKKLEISSVKTIEKENQTKEILLENIVIKDQVRTSYDKQYIDELADSIERQGLFMPITVYPTQSGGGYVILTGHNRFKAFEKLFYTDKKMSFNKIMAVVKKAPNSEDERIILQLVENVQRKDLPLDDLKRAIKILKEDYQLTFEIIASKIGKSVGYLNQIYIADKEKENLASMNLLETEKIKDNSDSAAYLIASLAPKEKEELFQNNQNITRDVVRNFKKEKENQLKELKEEKESASLFKATCFLKISNQEILDFLEANVLFILENLELTQKLSLFEIQDLTKTFSYQHTNDLYKIKLQSFFSKTFKLDFIYNEKTIWSLNFQNYSRLVDFLKDKNLMLKELYKKSLNTN